MLIDKLKADRDDARRHKQSDIVTILSTMIGEIERNANKNASDETVIANIKKTIANLEAYPVKTSSQAFEIGFLTEYLPKQLDADALRELFNLQPQITVDMKTWMSYLKENYPGRYDGKIASEIFKNNS